jgi:Uma2 family endonuclease
MAVTQRALTLEEFLDLPEEEPALEYEEGVVTQKMSPPFPHGMLQLDIGERVNAAGKPKKLARAIPELRIRLAGRSYVPDVSVYRWDRIPRRANGKPLDYATELPDIVWEIVSPTQSVSALVRRCLLYVANGIEIVCLVDPEAETVLVFRQGGGVEALVGAETIDLAPLLPDFSLPVEQLFGTLTAE